LTLLGGRCFGEIGRPHHELAAVVEMIHMATLVHDDVLDGADRRRGEPTVNAAAGNTVAVLLGDFVFATAFGLSASLDNRLASRYLSFIAGVVCQGEILQILETGNLALEEQTYLDVIEKKTAFLFGAAGRVGAEYAGATPEQADALGRYGLDLGTAFQIVDDCLDLDGDEATVGKTLGTDARQGKVTLPVIHFLRTAPGDRAAVLRGILAGGEGDTRRDEIKAMLGERGSLDYARDRARRLAARAATHLEGVPPSAWRDTLLELAEYSVRRRR
ncbi:MAG: polyprenyl synthetase family protein, partial [Planctomycetes bacterium]|nr:polyprenyl synthetase family protein [Planctomycetota bacterium]